MANNCLYSMKIVGDEKSCYEFVERLQDYDKPHHFYRIFTADIYDKEIVNGKTCLYVFGDCAWSLETCCRASGYSNGIDLFQVNTKELELKVEAYSREEGIGFEEHYLYDRGKCLIDDCLDIIMYYWDRDEFPTYDDYLCENPDAPPECQFEDTDEVYIGGFGENYENWHI